MKDIKGASCKAWAVCVLSPVADGVAPDQLLTHAAKFWHRCKVQARCASRAHQNLVGVSTQTNLAPPLPGLQMQVLWWGPAVPWLHKGVVAPKGVIVLHLIDHMLYTGFWIILCLSANAQVLSYTVVMHGTAPASCASTICVASIIRPATSGPATCTWQLRSGCMHHRIWNRMKKVARAV